MMYHWCWCHVIEMQHTTAAAYSQPVLNGRYAHITPDQSNRITHFWWFCSGSLPVLLHVNMLHVLTVHNITLETQWMHATRRHVFSLSVSLSLSLSLSLSVSLSPFQHCCLRWDDALDRGSRLPPEPTPDTKHLGVALHWERERLPALWVCAPGEGEYYSNWYSRQTLLFLLAHKLSCRSIHWRHRVPWERMERTRKTERGREGGREGEKEKERETLNESERKKARSASVCTVVSTT